MNRGTKNLTKLGEVVEYDNKKNFSLWNDEKCDDFGGGTDCSIFHPFFDKKGKDSISVVSSDICRRLEFNYDSFTFNYAGILLFQQIINLTKKTFFSMIKTLYHRYKFSSLHYRFGNRSWK